MIKYNEIKQIVYQQRFHMIFFREINPLSLKLLKRVHRQSRHHQVRHASSFPNFSIRRGKIEQLIKTFQVTRKTIYNWFERWESEGILGLYNKPGRCRQATFDSAQEYQIKEWTKQEPKQLKHVVQKIKETWGIKISTKTIKRILINFNMSWHRMRLDVGGEPDPSEYQEKKTHIAEFKQLEDRGKLDLYYLDETGFCLIPCVPYGWQERGKYL